MYKKLADKDLDKFVFRLSSTAEKKTSILEELNKRLEIDVPEIDDDYEINQSEYRTQVNKIRRYGKILDSPYFEVKKTGYEILTNVAKYKSYLDKFPKYFEEDPISKKAENLTNENLINNLSKLTDIQNIIAKLKNFKDIKNHPWFGLTEEKNNPYELKDLKKTLQKLQIKSKELNERCIFF